MEYASSSANALSTRAVYIVELLVAVDFAEYQ
jgi:hypothetical protein